MPDTSVAPTTLQTGNGAAAVTVLGTGSLGTSLAGALLGAGHPTTVWNRTRARAEPLAARGAEVAPSVAAAVGASPVLLIAVATYDDVGALLIADGVTLAGRTLVNLTSGTPEQARSMAARLEAAGAKYLDGAAMSGTERIGRPEALFVYGGDADAFAAVRPVLLALGRAEHVGPDVGAASYVDTALLSLNMGLLGGFYQGLAIVRAAGMPPRDFASLAVDYLPFATGLLMPHAGEIEAGDYPGVDGTLDVFAAAMAHVVETSRTNGVATDIPDAIATLIDRAVAAGHGRDGLARLAETIASDS